MAEPTTYQWDLYKDGVTQGFLNTFMTCPEKARLKAVEGYRTVYSSTAALDFGTVFHENLDNVYTDFSKQDVLIDNARYNLPTIVSYSKQTLVASSIQNDRRILQSNVHSEEHEKAYLNYGMAEVVLAQYWTQWRDDFEVRKWVALEQEFDIPYAIDNETSIRLRGKIDGVYQDSGGDYWLFETKTKGRIDDDAIVDRLTFDMQVGMYMYAIEQLYGVRPKGVLYNLIRRPQLRKSVKESVDEFIKRCADDVKARPSWYYLRYEVRILDEEVTRWRREFEYVMQQVNQWYQHLDFVAETVSYRNSTSCFTGYGACEFLKVCGNGDVSGFTRQARPYPELSLIELREKES